MICKIDNVTSLICDLCRDKSTEEVDIASISEQSTRTGAWLLWQGKHICPKCTLNAVELWLRFQKP